jgi:phosphate transport system substrate-binding protein
VYDKMFKKIFNDEAGVSPIVATLVLVVVAIAGAAAVGTIMGSFSNDVSDQANTDDMASGASAELLVAGSTTVQPVSELLAEAFMEEHGGVRVTVQAGGSSAGIASVGMGVIDIGAASKDPSDADIKEYDLKVHQIGGSGIAIITNTGSAPAAAGNITYEDLYALYDDDDSSDASVNVDVAYQRSEGSGTEETFAKFLKAAEDNYGTSGTNASMGEIGPGDSVDNAKSSSTTDVEGAIGNQGVLDAVAGSSDDAIGFVDYGFAASSDDVVILGIIDDDNIVGDGAGTVYVCNEDNILDKLSGEDDSAYPGKLARPLNYITKGEPTAVQQTFIDFARSPGAYQYFDECGYFAYGEFM